MTRILQDAVRIVFAKTSEKFDIEALALQFADGLQVTTGESLASIEYSSIIKNVEGLNEVIEKLTPGGTEANRASAIEFVLEGLHLNQLLNKERVGIHTTYMG